MHRHHRDARLLAGAAEGIEVRRIPLPEGVEEDLGAARAHREGLAQAFEGVLRVEAGGRDAAEHGASSFPVCFQAAFLPARPGAGRRVSGSHQKKRQGPRRKMFAAALLPCVQDAFLLFLRSFHSTHSEVVTKSEV